MTTPYHIALNGTALSSLDDTICVLDIREEAPTMRSTAVELYGGGQRLLRHERERLSIQASFAIQEPDVARREEIFQQVLAWAAAGGTLTMSSRYGQQLQVICTKLPTLNAEDWTEALHITFASSLVPYWEAISLTPVMTTSTSVLTLPGNSGAAPVNVQVVNHGSEPLAHLTLACGDTQMTFSGLSLPAGATFSLRYTGGVLTAQIGGESQLRFRTATSDDLLLAPCGWSCPVRVAADQPVSATFTARGRYL